MRLNAESVGLQKRYVYAPQIVCDANTPPDERWEIIGDLASRQRAEQFELYCHYEKQFRSERLAEEEDDDDYDVLWADAESLAYVNGNGVELFGSKTQGYPYHLAVLAVGMLIESRFPNQCYVFGDIDRVQVEAMAAKKEASDDFNIHALLKVLCSHFVIFNADVREPLNIFIRSQERLATIEDSFTQVFLTLSGAPSAIDFYCAAAELLDVFCEYEPDQRARFQAAITEEEQQCRDTLEKTQNLIRDIEQKMEKAEQQVQEKVVRDKACQTETMAVSDRPKLSDEEAYILQQAALQTKTFRDADADAVATHMHQQLRPLLEKHTKIAGSNDRSDLLQQMYWGSHENGFALNESAWQRIDEEQYLTTLKYLLMLSLIKEQAMSFWNWHTHIMEHPQMWPYLTGAQIQEVPPESASTPAKMSG